MNFKLFRLKLIIYIGLLVMGSVATIYIAIATPFWLMSVWTFLLVLMFSILIIRESEKSKREFHNFITSITFGEFKNTYKSKNKNDELNKAFDDLIGVYRKLSSEKERNHLYLQTIVEHINSALLCFDEDDNIVIINNAAKQFFGRTYILNTNVIKRFDESLAEIVNKIKSGQKKLYKFTKLGNTYNISIYATEFKLQDSPYKLVSIQDVKYEMEEQELDSWRKLVRVLTHEIMNTAIPISTLAGGTNQLLLDEKGKEKNLEALNIEDQKDLRLSLKTIEKRSKGMVEFVRATKSYTNMPQPKYKDVSLQQIVDNVISLLKPSFEGKNIRLVFEKDNQLPDLKLDVKLIEQLLINIIKNSMEALEKIKEGKIKISLSSAKNKNKIALAITDNGPGIDPDEMENVFVPFYTTKKEGSGIGLSLSRQIMRLHGGSIQISSEVEKGTKVELIF